VCTTLGFTEEELIGKGLDTQLDTACFADLRRRATGRATSSAPGGNEAELRMRRKDGRYVVVSVSASLLRTSTREYAGVICVAQDISDRLRLEAELRQAQKLQAIGRLASGVAHEINTPVQFVSDSVHFARDAATDLSRIIGTYQAGVRAVERGTPSEEAFAGAHAYEKESDLPYLLEKLPRALDRAVQGLDRIAAIVRSMKVFAHPGQAQMGPVDLNEAVRSTLTVAQSEYKHVADLEMDLGSLPLVTCHGGEINQAILNLVINAAHAIADNSNADAKGRITVRTRREGDSVVVSIGDTGTGIPEEIRDRIFDPFFTTKEVGKGTGQGLSVARSVIVEKHRGQLTFETEHGKGTTFHIRLPIGGALAPLAVPLTAPAAA
jgi:PAS domain S-box-containing protein